MHPLAQVDPAAVGAWLQVFFYLAGGIAGCLVAYKQLSGKGGRTEISGQPIEVKEHPGIVSRADLEKVDNALHGRLKRERLEIDAQIHRVEQTAEKRADKLEGKVDENTKLTAEMCGQLGQMNQEMHALTSSVTSFLRDAANRK